MSPMSPSLWMVALLVVCAGEAASAQNAPAGDAVRGRKIYVAYGCYQCHGYQGQGSNAGSKIAPDPTPYLAFALQLRTPRARMPAYPAVLVTDQQVADLYAYLQSVPKAKAASDIALLSPRGPTGD